jgi:hypothetical protein
MTDELSCVNTEALDVSTLAFGEQSVEGHGALAAAAGAGEHDERTLGDTERDVLEVVDASALDVDMIVAHLQRPHVEWIPERGLLY